MDFRGKWTGITVKKLAKHTMQLFYRIFGYFYVIVAKTSDNLDKWGKADAFWPTWGISAFLPYFWLFLRDNCKNVG